MTPQGKTKPDKQQTPNLNVFPGASGPPPSARARCAANSAPKISP